MRPRHPIRTLVLLGLIGVAVLVFRQLLAERAPSRRLDADGPLIGSLDTWPEVPRAPKRATRAAS